MIERQDQADKKVGVLLSKSCTTGWRHWKHGALWLFPDGILRVPLGWLETGYIFNPRNTPPVDFDMDDADFADLTSEPRNLWISKDIIADATLRHTLFAADELRAELADGRPIQLLWMPNRYVFTILGTVLHEWLGDRLTVGKIKTNSNGNEATP